MALDNKAKAALAAAGFVSSGAFLYAARHLQSRINAAATSNGFTGDARELDMPDKLFGYSPQKLWDLFAAYGPKGRELFVKVELLDVLWFFPSYAALFGVIWGDLGSRLQRATGNGAWSRAPLLVGALVLSDAAENAAHLALLAKFNAAKGVKPQGWDRAAAVGSAVNQAKWWVGRVVLAGPLLWLLVAGRDALRRGK